MKKRLFIKMDIMRKIDSFLGPAICKFLLLIRRFSRPRPPLNNIPSIQNCRNILIVKFFGMGTILLASPMFRELKTKFKDAKITILTLDLNREICKMLSSIDEVISLKIDSFSGFIATFIKAVAEIRKQNFDIIINLEFLTNFSALITLMAELFERPKLVVGFNSPLNWRDSINDINVSFDHSRHITGIFAKMAHSLTGRIFQPSFEHEKNAFLENMDSRYVETLLANNKLANCSFFICVNISAGDVSLHRRWPKEYFAELVNKLAEKPELAILLIGGGGDVGYVSEFKKLLSSSPRIMDVSGRTNIRELIGLFRKSSLLITNDGGPLHLAAVIGLPTVSFFGPETPYLYGPVNKGHYVFYDDLYCSP